MQSQPGRASWWKEFRDILVQPNFEAFLESEFKATKIDFFNGNCLVGLFQTEAYATATTKIIRTVPQTVQIRMLRQWHVLEKPEPPLIRLILAEHILYREVGGRDVLREQLWHLSELAKQPNINIYLLPKKAAGSKFSLEFENFIIHTKNLNSRGVLYIDHSMGMYRSINQFEVVSCKIGFEDLLQQTLSKEESMQRLVEMAQNLALPE
ncbi:MAG TPA: DUF5753 domain-containing protein [Candidatus Saccharimonadales bacterium]|nr:DUF5753 domain-containing protein [Candidatus Saccharimonadales bacterium]